MNKMKRSALAFVLVFSMAFGVGALTACGSSSSSASAAASSAAAAASASAASGESAGSGDAQDDCFGDDLPARKSDNSSASSN